jgi:predicted transcriptional regulator
MTELKVHVGDTLQDMGQRFIDAWHRAEQGDDRAERHLSFESFEAMSHVLSAKRLELLRRIHGGGAVSIAALARSLNRDYRRVHADVRALEAAGLIEHQAGKGLSTPYDSIGAVIAL